MERTQYVAKGLIKLDLPESKHTAEFLAACDAGAPHPPGAFFKKLGMVRSIVSCNQRQPGHSPACARALRLCRDSYHANWLQNASWMVGTGVCGLLERPLCQRRGRQARKWSEQHEDSTALRPTYEAPTVTYASCKFAYTCDTWQPSGGSRGLDCVAMGTR